MNYQQKKTTEKKRKGEEVGVDNVGTQTWVRRS
jgi:hypothetical protein